MNTIAIKEISLCLYNDYKHRYQIFIDKILSKSQFVSFVSMALYEYRGGTHDVKFVTNDWTLWCYHRCVGITYAPTCREIVIETLDAPFYYHASEYDSIDELVYDISCFVELFEYAYQKYRGGQK